MKLAPVLAFAATLAFSSPEGPKASETDQVAEALRTIKAVKQELIVALGNKIEGFKPDEYGRPSAVACGSSESSFEAYHRTADAARSIVRDRTKGTVNGFINTHEQVETEAGNVVCVKSSATSIKEDEEKK